MELYLEEDKFLDPVYVEPYPSRWVPTHLRIAGTELLGSTRRTGEIVAVGRSLNPLELARWGLCAVRKTGAYGYGSFSDDETPLCLLMRLSGDAALLHWTGTRRTARVPYTSLLATWEAFNAHMRALTLRLVPDFARTPTIETVPPPQREGSGRRPRFIKPDIKTMYAPRSRAVPLFSEREQARWLHWLRGEEDPLTPPMTHEELRRPRDDPKPWSHIDAEEVE